MGSKSPRFPGPKRHEDSSYALRYVVDYNGKFVELTIELPGLEEKDIEIDFTDDVLTIKGEKAPEMKEKDPSRAVSRRNRSFAQSIVLPTGLDPTRTVARIRDGILRIKMPRALSSTPENNEIRDRARFLIL